MPCGPYQEARMCREKCGPTSIRSSLRSRKRHIVRRVFNTHAAGGANASAGPNAGQPYTLNGNTYHAQTKPYRQKNVPIVHDVRQKVSGTDYVRFKIWRSMTRTSCMPNARPGFGFLSGAGPPFPPGPTVVQSTLAGNNSNIY